MKFYNSGRLRAVKIKQRLHLPLIISRIVLDVLPSLLLRAGFFLFLLEKLDIVFSFHSGGKGFSTVPVHRPAVPTETAPALPPAWF